MLDATTLASGIAGLAYRGPTARLVKQLLAGTFEAVPCPTLIDELRRALGKPYFAGQVSAALEVLTAISVLCTDPTDPSRVPRDPNDDYLLALAASAGAQAIVTGDWARLSIPAFTRRRSPLVRLSSSWGSHSTARRPHQVRVQRAALVPDGALGLSAGHPGTTTVLGASVLGLDALIPHRSDLDRSNPRAASNI